MKGPKKAARASHFHSLIVILKTPLLTSERLHNIAKANAKRKTFNNCGFISFIILLATTCIEAKLKADVTAHMNDDQSFKLKLRASSFITIMPKTIIATVIQTLKFTNSFRKIQLSNIAIIISLLLTKTSKVGESWLRALQIE